MRVSALNGIAFIEANSIPEPNTGCWLWLRSVDGRGYGLTGLSSKKERKAHRYAFFAQKPDGDRRLFVLHQCDQPGCVNPAHLRLGTQLENMADAKKRGRVAAGDRHYRRRAGKCR